MSGLSETDREALQDWWDSGEDFDADWSLATLYFAVEAIVARAVNEALTEAADELDAKVPARRKHHFAEVEAMDNTFKRAAAIVRARIT